MDYVLSKFKIRKGKLELARRFLENLHLESQNEMRDVLDEARMTLDCSFIDGETLYVFKRIEDHAALKERFRDSVLPIYTKIRGWADQIVETAEDIPVVAVFDLTEQGGDGVKT